MKKINLILIIFLALAQLAVAQHVPLGMKYQAVARDLSGNILADQEVNLQIDLVALGEKQEKTVTYSEIHAMRTNNLGLFSLTIGAGAPQIGTFQKVPWSTEDIWMEIKIQENKNDDFVTISNSKILSVPYAFHAATATELVNGTINTSGNGSGNGIENGNSSQNGVPSQNWSLFGNSNSDPADDKLGTTDCADLVIVTDNAERLRILCSGKLIIDSDLDIGNDLDVGNNTNIGNDLTVQNNVEVNIQGGNTIVHGNLDVVDGSDTYLSGNLVVDGTTDLNSSLDVNNNSPTNLTGTLNVDGTTDLNSSLDVDGATDLNSSLVVDGTTNLNSSLDVNNNSPTKLTGTLTVNGISNFNQHAFFNNFLSAGSNVFLNTSGGGTTIYGATNINNTLNVSGNTSFASCLQAGGGVGQARFKFNPSYVNGSEGSFNNYPLQISNSSQGMAIQVTNHAPTSNFLAFFAGNEMQGRIEGNTGFLVQNFNNTAQNLVQYEPNEANANNVPSDTLSNASGNVSSAGNTQLPIDEIPASQVNTEELVEFIVLAVEVIVATITLASSFTSILDPVDIFETSLALAISITNLGVFVGFSLANVGVAYESGSGDYAEWLQKDNIEEVFHYGDVVGVIGGKISKTYVDADKFMVVSAAPAVVGAMPPSAEEEANYEKIAFIGQVPVKVMGEVHVGDYILPSGEGDGLAIAISRDEMKAKDYIRIIGVAWEDWKEEDRNKIYQLINCAIGINQNDMGGMIEQMQIVMNQMQDAIKEINPDYEGFVFETGDKKLQMDVDYSVSGTHASNMAGYFDGKEYETREELGMLVKEAMETQAGIDLDEYPMIERMLLDPEYAEAAKEHYSNLLVDYLALLDEIKSRKN